MAKWSADQIATVILKEADRKGLEVQHLKLQKLLFYSQAYHLAISGEPLFDDTIEAWQSGPVVRELWHMIDKYTTLESLTKRPAVSLTSVAAAAIGLALADFGSCTGAQLKELTHKPGTPWSNAWLLGKNTEITHIEMRRHFQAAELVSRADQLRDAAGFPVWTTLTAAQSAEIAKRLAGPAKPNSAMVAFLSKPTIADTGELDRILATRSA